MDAPNPFFAWIDEMMKLHGYWRSSASYRVRIALALKGVEVEHIAVNLREGEQGEREHLSRNPQGFVPVLEFEDGTELTQSLAIMDYIDATFREPHLMPGDAILRSKILSASLIIASDVSPIQNLSVLKYLRAEYEQGDEDVREWVQHWITRGFKALEQIASGSDTPFLFTERPMFFECCLIPQVYNALRFGVDMDRFPKLKAIDAKCRELDAFKQAAPENQHDAF
ncbi:MAG: maleylacetoacetate isomerase [Litorimonas sp.]